MDVQAGGLVFSGGGNAQFDNPSWLKSAMGSTLDLNGSLDREYQNNTQFTPAGNTYFRKAGATWEVMGRRGNVIAGYDRNSAFGSVQLSAGMKLVDNENYLRERDPRQSIAIC